MHIKPSSRRWLVFVALSALVTAPARARIQPLQDATCELPPELLSVAGHALFRYIVEPDGSVGKITDVYVTAEPSEKRERFARALRGCMSKWRYTPDHFLGQAISNQLLMAFHYFRPVPAGAPEVQLSGGRSIPVAHLEVMRREKIALARRLIEGPDASEVAGRGYRVLTNVAPAQRKELIEAIDSAMAAFGRVFPAAPPLPPSSKLTVFLFRDQESFNEVAAFDNLTRMAGGLAGQYAPADQTAYTSLGSGPTRVAISYLVHEVTHHLIHQRLVTDPRTPPYWVNEGIATFIELMRGDGSDHLARFERGTQKEGRYRWPGQGDVYLSALKGAEAAKRMPDLMEFLSGSPRLGPMDSQIAYGLSWLLVHYLTAGDRGARHERFEQWLRTTADADRGASILDAVETTAGQLEQALSSYRNQLQKSAY